MIKAEREVFCIGRRSDSDRCDLTTARPSFARIAFIAALALAVAFQAVRSAAVTRFLTERPDVAGLFWPEHPRVILALGMAEIGRSAAKGGSIQPQTLARVSEAARDAPLEIEPFLINGALALAQARPAEAELLFMEARRRDPRSSSARYFLAQLYLASGRTDKGLAEAALLARLVSGGSDALVPRLVKFARTPGSTDSLRRMFKVYPELADPVLASLVRQAENTDLVIALAGDAAGQGAPAWQIELLRGLVERGELKRAYGLWRKTASQDGAKPSLFNPDFVKLSAPPPFNWTLKSGDFGVAEPAQPGGLQIIYYGRDNAEFANQLMLLSPGRYELRMEIERQADSEERSGLAWSLSCQPGGRQILHIPLDVSSGTKARLSTRFTVSEQCASQLLKLNGAARDPAVSEQVLVTNLQLVAGVR